MKSEANLLLHHIEYAHVRCTNRVRIDDVQPSGAAAVHKTRRNAHAASRDGMAVDTRCSR